MRKLIFHNPDVDFRRVVGPEDTMGAYEIAWVKINRGSDFPAHTHEHIVATIYIAEGRGYVLMNGKKHPVEPGTILYIPPGTVHEIFAEEPIVYLAVARYDWKKPGDGTIDFRFVEPSRN